jgi:ATP-dependent RNA helicase SUPV3L1/SUV3
LRFGVSFPIYGLMRDDGAELKAVLGPTNTGKTHLAVERMCAHSSGMIGFPLRLLAREVYERIVSIKGERQVALLTGEEKILPDTARWFCCTAESMPVERDFAFVALDEAQLASDVERGHVFTDRILNVRGREETMILGAESLKPMIRSLLPRAQIVTRPRFSTLSFSGPSKLSRLPPRSAIVAFSAEQVYAVAEMLRRTRGGAAVVMGALSPRTRNAQVAMYQAGEVDYLVATDAIGMGLNMDVGHVAFAGLTKFDGARRRRLTIAEMAQIAGRAGRHQRDGTFGTLAATGEPMDELLTNEIEAIEAHRFAPLDHLFWRESSLDFRSIALLVRSLERRPVLPGLRPAPEAIDLAVLRLLAADPQVDERAGRGQVRRLWAACGLPDFRKTGPEQHSRLVARIFLHLSEGDGHIPQSWYASELARLDNVQGDIDALADRLAAVRTWAFIAQRPDWLAEPAAMARRAMEIEERLSDALHERLTQRFVDRRTSALMHDLGKGQPAAVSIDDDGEVSVGSFPIGRLSGFAFKVDPAARHSDRKMLLATAERRLAGEFERRAAALVADKDDAFSLRSEPDLPVAIFWQGHEVARLEPGKNLLSPRVALDRAMAALGARTREAVGGRLIEWVGAQVEERLSQLRRAGHEARDPAAPAALRALLARLVDNGGTVRRDEIAAPLAALDRAQRRVLGKLGITIGALDLFMPQLLKPEAMRWRAALGAAARGLPMPALPPGSSVVIPAARDPLLLERLGFRPAGPQMIRIDVAERIAKRALGARARNEEPLDGALVASLGLKPAAVARLMRDIGFLPSNESWVWRGRARQRRQSPREPSHAFAALAGLKRG